MQVYDARSVTEPHDGHSAFTISAAISRGLHTACLQPLQTVWVRSVIDRNGRDVPLRQFQVEVGKLKRYVTRKHPDGGLLITRVK